jgi:hypothetical protein
MKKILGTTVALALIALFVSSAQAIKIEQATIQNGYVVIKGNQASKQAPVSWEGIALGINSNNGGVFNFNTTDLPPDCVGRLKVGTEEIDVVISNCEPAGVPKTGQTASDATGDDGALEKGVAWPQPRFNDNGNGTITDKLTGLIWLQNANCFGQQPWATAISDANGLFNGACGLTDGSVAGDWRLPNIRELQSLVDYGQSNPALPSNSHFTSFQSSGYWSSTTKADNSIVAWYVFFPDGAVDRVGKINIGYVIAVRGGS